MECDGINPDQDPATEGLEESGAAVSEEAPHDDPDQKPSVQDIPLHEEDPSSTQNGSASTGGCCDHSDDEDENKMLCILQFNHSTNMATRNWLLSSLKVCGVSNMSIFYKG